MTNSLSAPAIGTPSRRAWLVWCVGVIGYVVAIASRSSLAATGLAAAERFDITASVLSTFAVVQVLVYGAMQIPVGILLDRWGSRVLLSGGAFLMALGHVLTAVAPDAGWVILARAVVGLGDATTFVSVLRLIPAWFPSRVTPVLVQVSGMIGMLGQLVSVFPFALLLAVGGWTAAFSGLAGIAVVAGASAAAVVRDAPAGAPSVRVPRMRNALAGIRQAWRNPTTRLGFWAHFSTPFASTVFSLLWGYPFLVAGEGLSVSDASAVMAALVCANLAAGPAMGALVGARPAWRTRIVLVVIGLQAVALAAVLAWPGAAPLPLLCAFACVISLGGPASMVAFDFARTGNPLSRLGVANGIVNVGGFLASALVIGGIGLLLDAQGAGSPVDHTLAAFRIAMLAHMPVWAVGVLNVVRLSRVVARSGTSSFPPAAPSPPRSAS